MEWAKHSLEKSIDPSPCTDLFLISWYPDMQEQSNIEMLASEAGESAQSCADFQEHCHVVYKLINQYMRAHCPQTCGCGEPLSGSVVTGVLDHCPPSCIEIRQQRLSGPAGDKDHIPCQDVDSLYPGLRRFAAGLYALTEVTTDMPADLARIVDLHLSAHGCTSFVNDSRLFGAAFHDRWPSFLADMFACDPSASLFGGGRMSLRPLCPVTCGCSNAIVKTDCPSACFQSTG